ncbi:MAG: hypothetical protein K0R39_1944 [Symbiobacteriaceae bacterium]|jgi:hypothetical protein|nr:hypothetical protein [Symbiobacteriaceae bacterium]
MLRKTLASMLAALLVVAGSSTALAATAISAGPGTSPAPALPAAPRTDTAPKQGPLTLSGTLEYVTSISAPHYEVNGYVLIFPEQAALDSLAGQQVIVTGTPVTGPSIYMRKSITVESILETAAYTPALPPATPAIPPVTSPTLPPVENVQTPAPEPMPLWGSPYYILFGQLEADGDTHVLVQETRAGFARLLLRSTDVDLTALVGERVGLIVSRDPGIEGSRCYNVIAAVALNGDLGSQLHLGPIYLAPQRPITLVLRNQELALDQAPIVGNGRTLIPLRAIGEALGAQVDWDQATRTATVTLGAREVKVTVGSNQVTVSEPGRAEEIIYSDIAPVIAGGRTLVPVRVFAESLGLKVGWDEATHTVTLN